MLTNPLVCINLETGKPWNDVEIARRCVVSDRMVAKHRADLAAELAAKAAAKAAAEPADKPISETFGDSERTVTRGGTTYTMKTAGRFVSLAAALTDTVPASIAASSSGTASSTTFLASR
jgi:hypothetical protein